MFGTSLLPLVSEDGFFAGWGNSCREMLMRCAVCRGAVQLLEGSMLSK